MRQPDDRDDEEATTIALNLPAIRKKCAELVGWTEIRQGTSDLIGTSTDGRIAWQLPNYPESADAALQLVEWMEDKCSVDVNFRHDVTVTFWDFANESLKVVEARADTFALAVCLVFLKANNIEPETLQ
jgi:hypothetical protein